MRRRLLAAVIYAIGLATALVFETPLILALVSFSVVSLTVGYRYRSALATFTAGWLLYYPLALTLVFLLGPVAAYLAAGVAVTALSERLSFENELSLVVEAPTVVDAEALGLANRLAAAHTKKLAQFLLVVVVVFAASVPLAGLTPTAAVVMSVAVILMFVTYAYVRRG
jgi:hypothetical protein